MSKLIGQCEYSPCSKDATTVIVDNGTMKVCDRCAQVVRDFNILEPLLRNTFLPTMIDDDTPGKSRIAHVSEFMHMGEENGMVGFKHCDTRRYLYLENGELIVPKDFECMA